MSAADTNADLVQKHQPCMAWRRALCCTASGPAHLVPAPMSPHALTFVQYLLPGMLQEHAGQDGGGDWRGQARRRPRRPRPELVLHIAAAEGLQPVMDPTDGARSGCSSAVKQMPSNALALPANWMEACSRATASTLVGMIATAGGTRQHRRCTDTMRGVALIYLWVPVQAALLTGHSVSGPQAGDVRRCCMWGCRQDRRLGHQGATFRVLVLTRPAIFIATTLH
jgi:hypothetical protein